MSGSNLHFETVSEKVKLNESVCKIELVKAYYYGYGRNAWYSTWSSFYCPANIYSDFFEIRRKIEKERKQGSVFKITEIPGLLITTNESRYIAIDYSRTKSAYDNDVFKLFISRISKSPDFFNEGLKLLKIVDYISCSTERYGFYVINENPYFQPIKESNFKLFTSHSEGTNYSLSYTSEMINYDCSYAKKFIELFEMSKSETITQTPEYDWRKACGYKS